MGEAQKCCLKVLERQIVAVKPQLILACGKMAVDSLNRIKEFINKRHWKMKDVVGKGYSHPLQKEGPTEMHSLLCIPCRGSRNKMGWWKRRTKEILERS